LQSAVVLKQEILSSPRPRVKREDWCGCDSCERAWTSNVITLWSV